MSRPRQTQSYLRSLFAQRRVAPRHRFGQNFLIDLNIHDLIVKSADLGPDDVVLEVGSGAGALTTLMAATAVAVVAVDVDPAMAAFTREATAEFPNVRVLEADALAGKNTLNPVLIDHLRVELAISPSRRLKLVANLPYNVATPIISNLLVHPNLRPVKLVATIQLELAERMRAAPKTSDYGALSVLIQALTNVELVRVLPPSVFWPRPKVDSAVIALTPDPIKRAAIEDLPWFHAVVRGVFQHRRKNLRVALHAAFANSLSKPEADILLAGLGLDGQIRAEALNVEEFLGLARALADCAPHQSTNRTQ